MNFQAIHFSVTRALPEPPLARYASLAFSLSVLSFLFSIAVSQVTLTLATLLFLAHLWRNKPSLRFPPIRLPLLLFCLTTILSVLLSANIGAGVFAVRKLVLFVIILLTANLIVSLPHLQFLLKGLFLEAGLVGLVAAGQVFRQYLQARTLAPEEFYFTRTYTRATGFMGHWMDFSGQQMLVLAMLGAFCLWRPKVKWIALVGLVGVSLILSFTRGAWIGSAAAVCLLLSLKRPRLLWGIPVLALGTWLVAPSLVRDRVASILHPSSDPSIAIRYEMFRVGWNMMRRHPGLGVGPNRVNEVYEEYLPAGVTPIEGYHGHLHNNPLQLAAERGLLCLGAWLWLMALWGRHFLGLRRRLGDSGYIADGALAAWLALLVQGMFEFSFGSSEVLMLFLFLTTAPFVAAEIEKASSPHSGKESSASSGGVARAE